MLTNQIHIANLTQLPTKVIVKNGEIGCAIHVLTPHKGEVMIDYDTTHWIQGTRDVLPSVIVEQLHCLEAEAHRHLFKEWKAITKEWASSV